jgi:hypothetical protein
MTPEQHALLLETHQLVRENNKMLHAARRSAIIGGILKIAMYAAFIVLPTYFFYTNIVPMLTATSEKVGAAQETVQDATQKMQNITNTIEQFKSLLNGGNANQ